MNLAGLGLAIMCLVLIAGQLVAHKFIKKVTNTYWFWLGIGLFCLIWLLVFRFVPAWQRYMEATNLDGRYYSDAFVISKAWELDICPFMGLFMTVSVVVDPTRKLARTAAPLALIGGILIVFIQMPFDDMAEFTAHFIFLGDEPNNCYFFLHAVNLFFSIGVMLNSPKYTWKGWASCAALAALYYSYVLIARHALGCEWFVSGTHINDWTPQGEYFKVAEILNCSPQVAMGVGFPFCICVCSGFIALNDYVFKSGWFRYGNKYSGIWWAWYDYNRYCNIKFI